MPFELFQVASLEFARKNDIRTLNEVCGVDQELIAVGGDFNSPWLIRVHLTNDDGDDEYKESIPL